MVMKVMDFDFSRNLLFVLGGTMDDGLRREKSTGNRKPTKPDPRNCKEE